MRQSAAQQATARTRCVCPIGPPIEMAPASAPIVINQFVIVGSSSGNVYALDEATGAQVWVGSAGGAISAPDEQNVVRPLTGFGAGEGLLVVPAGNVLTG